MPVSSNTCAPLLKCCQVPWHLIDSQCGSSRLLSSLRESQYNSRLSYTARRRKANPCTAVPTSFRITGFHCIHHDIWCFALLIFYKLPRFKLRIFSVSAMYDLCGRMIGLEGTFLVKPVKRKLLKWAVLRLCSFIRGKISTLQVWWIAIHCVLWLSNQERTQISFLQSHL